MKSTAFACVCNAPASVQKALFPGLVELLSCAQKPCTVLTDNESCKDDFASALGSKGTLTSVSSADLLSKLGALRSDEHIVCVLPKTCEDQASLVDTAKKLAKEAVPALLVFAADSSVAPEALAKDLSAKLASLEPCGLYPLATIIVGPSLSKACEEELNCKFSHLGEMPLFFIPEKETAQFARFVNVDALAKKLFAAKTLPMAPELFALELAQRARAAKQRIVLAEGEEERILRATDVLLRQEIAEIILLGDTKAITSKANELGLDVSKATLINPKESPKYEDYAETFYELRKSKGVTLDDAKKVMLDPTYYGTMMVKKGDADGMVSGAINTTAHTIRPALQFIKTKKGFSVVSSCFLMCLHDRVLVFGDCAVNPNPTAEQLAEIAITTANTAMAFGIEPRVAMISYSSGNSGKGPDVDLVIEATKLAREKDPSLLIDGPLQYDAAFDPTVAKTKMPNSPVAGQATVFIFPSLTTGNTTYKAVQRAANAIAIGPVLQGLNKPVNDLSRGCLVPDIINTVAITAVQASAEK